MLDRETIAKVRRIRLRTKVILESGIVGSYSAVFKGRGMEFAEVREYQPGDDIRTIDWNVTARLGQVYVKRYVEERDLSLLLVVDLSGSQRFGSGFLTKRDLAAELSAVLAFSAVANHDRVGAVLFTDRVERYIPPARGQDHALRIVHDLLALQPAGRGTNIGEAAHFALGVMKRRGIVAVISDFQDDNLQRPLGMLHRRHDVIAFRVWDPHELEVPAVGMITLADPETGDVRVVDTSDPWVRRRLATFSLPPAGEPLRSTGVDVLSLSTCESYERPLAAFFAAREKRR